jgi:hypothetical protein
MCRWQVSFRKDPGNRAGVLGIFFWRGRRDCRVDDLKWSRTINGYLKEEGNRQLSTPSLLKLSLPPAERKTISNLCHR